MTTQEDSLSSSAGWSHQIWWAPCSARDLICKILGDGRRHLAVGLWPPCAHITNPQSPPHAATVHMYTPTCTYTHTHIPYLIAYLLTYRQTHRHFTLWMEELNKAWMGLHTQVLLVLQEISHILRVGEVFLEQGSPTFFMCLMLFVLLSYLGCSAYRLPSPSLWD